MTIELKQTNRGFALGEFVDANDEPCSIQQSSIAMQDLIWLGRDVVPGIQMYPRMHLSRSTVAELLPLLVRFVETGRLTEDKGS